MKIDLEFRSWNDELVYVDIYSIVSVSEENGGTRLGLRGNHQIAVNEDVASVMKVIRETYK